MSDDERAAVASLHYNALVLKVIALERRVAQLEAMLRAMQAVTLADRFAPCCLYDAELSEEES
jgi:hypothetical protein